MISIHLTGNTELGQLLKLPRLISHFLEHHRADQDLSFLEFIAMHYAGDDGTSADDETDSKLPCHSISHSSITVSYSPMVRELLPVGSPLPAINRYSIPLSTGMITGYISKILQPPRSA